MNLKNITAAYLGSTSLNKMYLGEIPVFDPADDTIIKAYNFYEGLPAEFTYTRADTVASYRNSDGKLQWAGSNEYRLDHDITGTPLYGLSEYTKTNRFTNYNAVPTNTTGFSVTGDATITLADDATEIAAAKLDLIVTGDVFEASGGAGGGTVILPGTTGSTSACSFSAYARVVTGASASLTNTNASPNETEFTNENYERILLQNQTPDSTSIQMAFAIPAGVTIRFILPQLEVGPYTSTVIKTEGATATRQSDAIYDNSFNTRDWFNIDEMSIMAEYTPFVDKNVGGSAFAYYPFFTGLNTTTEGLGILYRGADYLHTPLGVAPGAPAINATSPVSFETSAVAYQPSMAGVAFKNGEKIMAFGDTFCDKLVEQFGTLTASNLSRLSVAHRNSGTTVLQNLQGGIRRLTIVNKYYTKKQLAVLMEDRSRQYFMCGGQSNMIRNFTISVQPGENGKLKFVEQINNYWTAGTDNFACNGGWDGSRVLKSGLTTGGWWYDESDGSDGNALIRFKERALAMRATGAECKFIIWDQGEADTGKDMALYKEALLIVFGRMREVVGDVPVIIRTIGRRGDAVSSNTHYQLMQDTQREVIAENDWIYNAPEKITEPLADTVHLTQDGYVNNATPFIRKALKVIGEDVEGTIDGPEIIYADRSGDVIDIYVQYDTGADDFTGDQGFRFTDDGVEITGTLTRVAGNHMQYTLDITPSGTGTEILYYGYGTLYAYVSTWEDLIKDNSEYQLSLRRINTPLPYYKNGPSDFDGLVIWYDSNRETTVEQRTDLSGNGNDAFQDVVSRQPTIVTDYLNGKDALKFDSVDDELGILTNAQLQAIADEITIEFVIAGTPASSFKILFRNDETDFGLLLQNDSNGGSGSVDSRFFGVVKTSAGSQTLATRIGGVFDGNPHHCVFRANNGSVDFFLDNVKTNMGTYNVGTSGFASTQNWRHHVADNLHDLLFCVYDNALSDEDIALKYSYAQLRWDL